MRRIDLEWFSMLTTWIPKSWTSINCINFPNINCFVSRSCFGIKSAWKQWNTEYDAEKHNNTVEVSCGETIQQNGRAGVPSMSHALPSSAHFNFQFWFNINWDWTLPSSAHFNVQFWYYQLKMNPDLLCSFEYSILIQNQMKMISTVLC